LTDNDANGELIDLPAVESVAILLTTPHRIEGLEDELHR
jgi:hypothetical protein